MDLRRGATFVLAGLLIAGTARVASAQQTAQSSQGQRECVLRKDANGLIRGRSQPKGCVLVLEEDVTSQQALARPAIAREERIIHTPTATRTVLVNCARLSGGRMVIPTVPPSEKVVEARHFGPLFRHFGPIQSSFGPLERHFGLLERHFGPLQRNFGSSSRPKSGGKRP
ncbi:MAG: hypothetical protein JSW46_15850 [Gemmatimonadota bacterium]|nr:MAG: hypothetical protein JSW46_15850 [Gemmatimonadota bacterium]